MFTLSDDGQPVPWTWTCWPSTSPVEGVTVNVRASGTGAGSAGGRVVSGGSVVVGSALTGAAERRHPRINARTPARRTAANLVRVPHRDALVHEAVVGRDHEEAALGAAVDPAELGPERRPRAEVPVDVHAVALGGGEVGPLEVAVEVVAAELDAPVVAGEHPGAPDVDPV